MPCNTVPRTYHGRAADGLCCVLQALDAEVERAFKQGAAQLHFSSGQHRLALLYLLDAICTPARNGQAALDSRAQARLRAAVSAALPQLVQRLATPCNCDRVRTACVAPEPGSVCWSAPSCIALPEALAPLPSCNVQGLTWRDCNAVCVLVVDLAVLIVVTRWREHAIHSHADPVRVALLQPVRLALKHELSPHSFWPCAGGRPTTHMATPRRRSAHPQGKHRGQPKAGCGRKAGAAEGPCTA